MTIQKESVRNMSNKGKQIKHTKKNPEEGNIKGKKIF